MESLKDQIIEGWFNDLTYKNLKCIEVNSQYLVCMEDDGTIRAFNNRFVKEITCKKRTDRISSPNDLEIDKLETNILETLEKDAGGFIPERQTQDFRLDEMRKCSSDDDFSISSNLGVRE